MALEIKGVNEPPITAVRSWAPIAQWAICAPITLRLAVSGNISVVFAAFVIIVAAIVINDLRRS